MKHIKECRNFYDYYQDEIVSRLVKIDLLIKSGGRIGRRELADAIGVSTDEISEILSKHHMKKLGRVQLRLILNEGSSTICKLYRREVEKGSPLVYTREDIAYIYGLDLRELNRVCDELGIIETTAQFFPLIFERLPLAGSKAKSAG